MITNSQKTDYRKDLNLIKDIQLKQKKRNQLQKRNQSCLIMKTLKHSTEFGNKKRMPVIAIAIPVKVCTGGSSQCTKAIKRKKKKDWKGRNKTCILYMANMIMYVEYPKIIYKLLEFIDTKSILKNQLHIYILAITNQKIIFKSDTHSDIKYIKYL